MVWWFLFLTLIFAVDWALNISTGSISTIFPHLTPAWIHSREGNLLDSQVFAGCEAKCKHVLTYTELEFISAREGDGGRGGEGGRERDRQRERERGRERERPRFNTQREKSQNCVKSMAGSRHSLKTPAWKTAIKFPSCHTRHFVVTSPVNHALYRQQLYSKVHSCSFCLAAIQVSAVVPLACTALLAPSISYFAFDNLHNVMP